MLNLDKESRIDEEELYDLCPDELKIKYPLTECYTHNEEIISTKLPDFQKITEKNLGILYEWLLNLKFKLKLKASLFNATQIFFKYLHLKNTDKKHRNKGSLDTKVRLTKSLDEGELLTQRLVCLVALGSPHTGTPHPGDGQHVDAIFGKGVQRLL